MERLIGQLSPAIVAAYQGAVSARTGLLDGVLTEVHSRRLPTHGPRLIEKAIRPAAKIEKRQTRARRLVMGEIALLKRARRHAVGQCDQTAERFVQRP